MTRSELESAFDDMEYRFGCLLDHATGGRMSKTNYTKETMYGGVNDHIRSCVDDEAPEIIEEFLCNLEITDDMVLTGARAAAPDYDAMTDEWQKAAIRKTVRDAIAAVLPTLAVTE